MRNDLGMPNAADRLFDDLASAAAGLARMPKRFRVAYENASDALSVRRMNVRKYVVLYVVDDDEGVVTIIAVLYGSLSQRRIKRVLEEGANRQ